MLVVVIRTIWRISLEIIRSFSKFTRPSTCVSLPEQLWKQRTGILRNKMKCLNVSHLLSLSLSVHIIYILYIHTRLHSHHPQRSQNTFSIHCSSTFILTIKHGCLKAGNIHRLNEWQYYLCKDNQRHDVSRLDRLPKLTSSHPLSFLLSAFQASGRKSTAALCLMLWAVSHNISSSTLSYICTN